MAYDVGMSLMRVQTMWRTLAIFLVAMTVPALSPAQPVKSVQQTLIDLERQWNAAFLRGDVAFIESILADEFEVTFDNGSRADKKRELALAAAFDRQIHASALEDFDVKVYDNTAVVRFTLHLVGPVNGSPVQISYRYMDVWVLRNGRWLCVASQSTRAGRTPVE